MFVNPAYDPPYDSPLEDEFALQLAKFIDRRANVEKQAEVKTICGCFRLDFLVTTAKGFRVGYECDGAEVHDIWRDEWRDAMILGTGAADAIVRIRGSDLTYHPYDVLLFLARWDPNVFSDRGRVVLAHAASDAAREYRLDADDMIPSCTCLARPTAEKPGFFA